MPSNNSHYHDRRRSRSRSPHRSSAKRSSRDRERSPERHHTSSYKRRRTPPAEKPVRLPFNAKELSKRDYEEYKPLFASYLDIQKQLLLEDMDEHEAKGRWKSFMGKWNRRELAEGWYDPETRQKTMQPTASYNNGVDTSFKRHRRKSPEYESRGPPQLDDGGSEDEFGPPPPVPRIDRKSGPSIPNREDLALRDELVHEDAAYKLDDIRYARKLDRKEQKERIEDLIPRPDPGSREKKLEKKSETTAVMRSFREAKSPGVEEVKDQDLMGGDCIEGYKARKKEAERKKNEREIRREELLRARAEEREERLAEHRAKEEKTMEMLRALAKQRYG
ncbi:hypothetical protein M501DRAFT_946209 [Patellaria atrata CBS 101060]|uniref:Uncharacterized protein n=1 Tax=Patellaria atrata CBS 101060 TaxID=1346257 RepID=A0A9P4SHM1_9PEZI|nr:hypothetical protein M501DRAFT_946209 [Patellaria atrata CBS 101060]